MKILMAIGGIVLFLVGVLFVVAAKSDIQIIGAVLCFGFGLGGVMERLDWAAKERRAAVPTAV